MNWEDKSNNEILNLQKVMQHQHEKVKADIMVLVEEMERIEKDFADSEKVILKRLKGEID